MRNSSKPLARLERAILSGASLLALAALPAFAQSQTGADNSNIETVMVTARKTSERLLDVPVSANAFGTQSLERYATTDLTTLGLQVPQVSIDHAASGNGAIITVRGIGSASVDAGIEQEVTVNIDGVPISRGRVIQSSIFDLSSVDVLKGPQPVYFGKNSPAGVITIASSDPDPEFGGYARFGYEPDTETVYGETAVSAPLMDDLSMRLAFRGSSMMGGTTTDVGGPITNPADLPAALRTFGLTLPGSPYSKYPGDQDYNGRATLKWTPTDSFDVTLKVLAGDHSDLGDSMGMVIYHCGAGNTLQAEDLGSIFFGGPFLLTDPYGQCNKDRKNSFGTVPAEVAAHYPGSNGGLPFTDIPVTLGSLTADYKLAPDVTLTNVLGYYKYDETQWSNYDFTDFTIASGQNDDHYKQLTEELRVATSFDSPLNFTGGFYYEHNDRRFIQSGFIAYFGPDPVTGQWNSFQSDSTYGDSTVSLFGEGRWKIADNLELAAGARWTSESQNANMRSTYVHPLLQLLDVALPPGESIVGRVSANNLSPEATLTWHPTQDAMFYAAYKQGFKSGGFSTPAVIPFDATVQTQQFRPETAKGFEVGAKFSEMDGRLTGDVTVYHYTYYGMQLTAFDAATTSYFTQNAASADTDGIEGNLSYQILQGLTGRADVGFNRARYGSFPNSQCWTGQTPAQGCVNGVQNLTGQALSRAPDWTANVGATYDRPITPAWNLEVTGDIHYSDGYYLETNNNPYGHQPSYTTLDASIRLFSDTYELAIIGRNLTDTYYAVLAGDKPLGTPGEVQAMLGQPREIFLQGTYHF